MKRLSRGAMFVVAMFPVIPAVASTTTFNFTDGMNGTYGNATVATKCLSGTNGSCGSQSDLSAYSVTPSGQTGTPITATAYAFYSTSTTGVLNGGGNAAGGSAGKAAIGEYSGAGIGVCENGTDTGSNCNSPYHQIDNGNNPGSSGGQQYEFVLIQFSAAVNLSSIQLANYGSGGSDPFIASYFTSTSSATNLGTALAGTSLSSLGNSFSTLQATTCPGCTASQTPSETLNGTDVTYLLFGASIASGQTGLDFFKIQDVSASAYTAVVGTPEPATFGLIGMALVGLGLAGRRRKKR